MVWHLAEPCPPWLKDRWIDWLGPERIYELYGGTEGQSATTISGAATTGKMFTATTWCTGNRKLLSGGYTLRDGEANLHDLVITQDAPRLTSGNGGWTASVEVNNANLNKTAGSLTAYAVCAG